MDISIEYNIIMYLIKILIKCYSFFQTHEYLPGFRTRIFFADPDPDPGKNLHVDPDPGGIRGRGLGIKGKNDFFF